MQLSETTIKDFGPSPDRIVVTIKSVVNAEGIAITTTAGGGYNSGLSRVFPYGNQPTPEHIKQVTNSARIFYGHVKDCAKAGKGVWQIEAEIAALLDMEKAIDGDEIAARINAEVDAHHAATVAAHNEAVTAVADIMVGTAQTGGWYGARKAAQQTAAPASDAMARILAQAERDSGRIARSKDATSTQLVALAKRGLVDLVYGRRCNQRVITGATLVRNLSAVAA